MALKKIHWTEHSKVKMRQYGLSVSKLLGVLRKPERCEEGIVPGTVTVMRTNPASLKLRGASKKNSKWAWGKKKNPGEIWIMYKDAKDFRKIISAWRYPGVTKPGEPAPVPDDIKKYLESGICM